MELSAATRQAAYPAPSAMTRSSRRETFQFIAWGAAILFFGFGDTLTSLLVFGAGGAESNVLLGAVLTFLGPSVRNFLIVKAAATVAPVLLARLDRRVEPFICGAMLLVGVYLVAQNLAALLF
ncbi:MAG: hypothetical protein HY681_14460 [Chloroflexi bacterium]|nr:hypothetical protein [Chloroflexota bacterium]